MGQRKVVITGVGTIGPGFRSMQELSYSVQSGHVSCSPINRFSLSEFRSRLGFQIQENMFGQSLLDETSRIILYGQHALQEAIRNAKLSERLASPGCVLGTAVAGSWEMEKSFGSLSRYVESHTDHKLTAANAISFSHPAVEIFNGVTNETPCVITTGCTAGLDALGVGWMKVLGGEDVVIVVASEAPITPMVIASFEKIGALTKERTNPLAASQPFYRERSGFCIGEGAAAFILESEEHAQNRHISPLATIHSYSTTSSAFHMTSIHSSGESIKDSIECALDMASFKPSDISLISPHATSTLQNDLAEYSALKNIFKNLHTIPIYAGKANFGHALGASNLLELAAVTTIMSTGYAPPYPSDGKSEPAFGEIFLPNCPTRLQGRIITKNSSGFSGIHSCVVMEYM